MHVGIFGNGYKKALLSENIFHLRRPGEHLFSFNFLSVFCDAIIAVHQAKCILAQGRQLPWLPLYAWAP